MKNTIYTDADLNAELLRGEEYNGNTIEIVIDADSTPNQVLTIAAGTTTISETITPGTRNTIDIPQMIWNFGGDTTATLTKDGTDAETITITFPAAIDAGAGLNENGTNAYKMDGSATLQEQIVSLQNQVQTFSMQTLDYILPKTISQADIADGGSSTALTFEFEVTDAGGKISLFTSLQFLAETTVTGSTYADLNVTGSIALDGNAIATILHTYRDGRQLFTLDYLVENLSKGNHTVTVTFAAAGGSMTVMQFLSAFMLAAKSTGDGSKQVMPVFTNGQWAQGVLKTGLDPEKMTEAAYRHGVLSSVVKGYEFGKNTTPTYTELDAWLNSNYILWWHQTDGKMFYKKGETFTTDDGGTGYNRTEWFIPINRINGFTKIKYEARTRILHGEPLYSLGCGCAAVVNGELKRARYSSNHQADWTEYEIDISSLPYVDYINLLGNWGASEYRNILLIK